MKKILFALLISLLFVSGCTINKVSDKSVSDILENILYVDNNLSNTYMNGYELYLPQGVKVVDKSDFNLKIKDNTSIYYLYIDTIAYHYKVSNTFKENNSHFFSKKFTHNGKEGYIDIIEKDNYYFIVAMYNYAKIESYVNKDDFTNSVINMCSLLSSIKYNDKVIDGYVGNKTMILQEERFNIFDSNIENDNFLKYESEYGTYKDKIDIKQDNDVIDVDETIE